MRSKIGAGAVILAIALFAFGGLYVKAQAARADGDGGGNVGLIATSASIAQDPRTTSYDNFGWPGPTPARTESVVYSFANQPDANGPKCPLAFDDAGNMYGTTFSGGANNLGAVFKITPNGTESVLYSFKGGVDGSHPIGGLVHYSLENLLFGTTLYGGATNNGTVFFVNSAGTESTYYSFKGGSDGANPYSSLVMIGVDLYGTTYNGGAFGYGTVFKISHYVNTVLHSFNSAFPTLDGSYPYAGLVLHHGILYGTTTLGGASNFGTVFSTTTDGTYAMLHSFKGGSHDGQNPYGGVVFDTNENLYGTTYLGGAHNGGTIFKVSAVGKETVLHNFYRLSSDGANPYASMIRVGKNLYGTTYRGGSANAGTVFKITLAGVESVQHAFAGGTADGAYPYSDLLHGLGNTFYGTTLYGGTGNIGTVFKLSP